jgi:flagellar motor switch protein FliN/FliY
MRWRGAGRAARRVALTGTEPMSDHLPPDRQPFSRAFGSASPHSVPPFKNDLDVTIELGRTQMAMEDVLKLRSGAIVPLDNMAGDPVDVIINGRVVARGEVVVVEDTFCVRIVELLPSSKAA